MTECERCGKPLKAIGLARTNGKKTHNDWSSRKLHKCCWKKIKEEEELQKYINFYSLIKN